MKASSPTERAMANPADKQRGMTAGPIALGAAVAGLTLVVYQWVLFAVGISLRIFFPIAALFVAQSVFNGVVLACCAGELQPAEASGRNVGRQTALRCISVVLVGALLAMSGILPLVFAKFSGKKPSEPELVLAIGGLLAAAVLAVVVAPVVYALAVQHRAERRSPQ